MRYRIGSEAAEQVPVFDGLSTATVVYALLLAVYAPAVQLPGMTGCQTQAIAVEHPIRHRSWVPRQLGPSVRIPPGALSGQARFAW